jgi:hypothetical protein
MPACAGMTDDRRWAARTRGWMPACAGMTDGRAASRSYPGGSGGGPPSPRRKPPRPPPPPPVTPANAGVQRPPPPGKTHREWMPACAGMTDDRPWAARTRGRMPAFAGMTDAAPPPPRHPGERRGPAPGQDTPGMDASLRRHDGRSAVGCSYPGGSGAPPVTPAKAGVQPPGKTHREWMPACAGMTAGRAAGRMPVLQA